MPCGGAAPRSSRNAWSDTPWRSRASKTDPPLLRRTCGRDRRYVLAALDRGDKCAIRPCCDRLLRIAVSKALDVMPRVCGVVQLHVLPRWAWTPLRDETVSRLGANRLALALGCAQRSPARLRRLLFARSPRPRLSENTVKTQLREALAHMRVTLGEADTFLEDRHGRQHRSPARGQAACGSSSRGRDPAAAGHPEPGDCGPARPSATRTRRSVGGCHRRSRCRGACRRGSVAESRRRPERCGGAVDIDGSGPGTTTS